MRMGAGTCYIPLPEQLDPIRLPLDLIAYSRVFLSAFCEILMHLTEAIIIIRQIAQRYFSRKVKSIAH